MPAETRQDPRQDQAVLPAGVRLVLAEPGRVIVEASCEDGNRKADPEFVGAMAGWLGQTACGQGIRASAPECAATPVETQTRFLATPEAGRLRAVAEPLHQDAGHSLWRATVYQYRDGSAERKIAETSVTYLLGPDTRPEPTAEPRTLTKEEAPVAPVALEDAEAETPESGVAEKRRRQIFQGACEVIAKKGYPNASVREIAAAAGIPIPTMYQYIKSKEDILYMIASEAMKENFAFFSRSLRADRDPRERICRAIDAYLSYVSKNRRYINLVYSETRSFGPENREKIFDIERRFTALWQEIIEAGVETGDFQLADTWLAANMVYFFCNVWALRFWAIDQYSQDQAADTLKDLILGGLGHGRNEKGRNPNA